MPSILKLKIKLRDIKPDIWREFLVESNITFESLHKIIQLSFGWTNSHLHNFEVDNHIFSIPDDETENDDLDIKTPLTEFFYKKGQRALYTYDFGDGWEHTIEIVDVFEKEKGGNYPVCLAGKRNAPPEDCGSIPGYEDVMKALKAKAQGKKYDKELIEWLGDYDPERFDIKEANACILEPDKFFVDFRD